MNWKKRALSVAIVAAMTGGELLSSIGTISVSAADSQFAGEEWYDQIATVEVNREPARAHFTPYESKEKALENEQSSLDVDEEESAYKMSLNGEWKFKFAQKPADREKEARGEDAADYVEDWDVTDWDTIKVPSTIQAIKDEEGNFKYEKPIYVNQRYPWSNYESVTLGEEVVAPTVNNSVGQYKRTFTIPADWDGREVFVSFEGVESAFYLYVNGSRVGYAEDSYTTDEFNITEYLHEGENTIALEVYRWSTGSFLENQDFIRYSGIFRDVNLYSKNKVELRDFFVKTDLDDQYENATLTLDATIRNLGLEDAAGKTYTVTADLYDIDGTTKMWDEPMQMQVEVPQSKGTIEEKADDTGVTVTASKEVINPKKWFADTPNLYMLLIQLQDENGQVVETVCQRVGFREIEKVDINEEGQEQAQINGEKIMFRGTNRHETDVEDGRALTREDIKEDLFMMKQFNVNAIRTSHYPNNPYTYDLADELGFYVCDEANIESHQGATSSDIPSGFPIWNNSVMDRTKNMVERDKNHASIVIWSLGNEATYKTYTMDDNYCLYNSTRWILERDPSRLRKYERDNRYTKGDRENSMVDIYSSQYWGVSSVESHVANTANKAPYIQSEYAHSMGNALGNFKEYWDVFRKYPNAQGGFIWDWIDQSMTTKVEDVVTYYVNDPNTGNRVKFDGSFEEGRNGTKASVGAYVATGSGSMAANSDKGLTLDVWLKPGEYFSNSQQTFIGRSDSGYNIKINSNGVLEFFVDGWTAGVLTAEIPEDFTDGQWHRLTGTFEGRTYTLYYDGKQIATGSRSSDVDICDSSSNTTDIGIGTDPVYSGRTFNGAIDRAAIIKGVLTEEQIAQTADSLESVQDDIVYAIDFEEGTAEEEVTSYDADSYFGYGGDWGETVTDNDFCGNGLVNADRTPSSDLYEVKKVHQEVSFYDDGNAANGEVRIVNEFLNTNLNKYDISWTLKEDNQLLASGSLTEEQKNIEAQQEKTIVLDSFPSVSAVEGSDYVLAFSVTLKEDQAWAGNYGGHAGEEIAFEEFELSYDAAKAQPVLDASEMEELQVEETDESITITGTTAKENGQPFEIHFDKATGYISSYAVNGKVILEQGPTPNYYRAPVSNDPSFTSGMRDAAKNFTIDEEGISVTKNAKSVSIHVPGSIAGLDSPNTIDYVIYGNGQVVVTNSFTPAANSAVGDVARIGMRMTVAEGYENLTYYGNGPQANYVDRNTGSKLGVYTSTVTEQLEDKLLKPQENGNHTGVRWTALTDDEGTGILVTADDEMESSALHYSAEDLASYKHFYQVPKLDSTILTVDLVQRGLGNASCGPGPLSQYIIQRGVTYNHTFSISPITEKTDSEELTARSNVNLNSGMPLSGIKVNGADLTSFEPNTTEYTYTLLNGTFEEGTIPQVEAVAMSDDVEVTVTQAETLPGTATITAISPFGTEKTYNIHLEVVDELYASDMDWAVDKGGYYANSKDSCSCGAEAALYVDGVRTTFDKAIGSHAPAEVGINLEGKGITRFKAQAGISACQPSGNLANVNFVVKADGKEIFRQDAVRSGQSVAVDLDVTGVKVLSLICETNGADSNDHGLWADARFTAEKQEVEEPLYELREWIDFMESLSEEEYTPESWAVLQAAIDAAKAVEANPNATQAQIDQAVADMVKAFGGLEYGVQKQHLEAAVKAAEDILNLEQNYDEESLEVLKGLIDGAKAMLADSTATQDAVNQMVSDLINAIVQVAPDEELVSLESLIEAVEKLDGSKYTSDSWAELQAAVEAAKEVLADPNRAEGTLADAYLKLSEVIRGLVMRGNKAALATVIEKAEQILANASNYTESSISGLADALEAAKAVYDDEDATQAEVSKATEDLTNVLVQARLKGDVNSDGEVNTNDSTALLRYNAEMETLNAEALDGADVNGDGAADTKDAVLILQYVSEKIAEF